MLGDGHLRYPNLGRDRKRQTNYSGVVQPTGNARYEMTMSVKVFAFMQNLYDNVYSQYSNTGLNPFPNTSLPQHVGKPITQYYFGTQMLPIFTALHKL